MRLHRPQRTRRIAQLLVLAFVVHVFVLPQLGGARAALTTLHSLSPPLAVAALGLETAAIVSYGALTRVLLPPAHRPSLVLASGVALASIAVNHVVPGGAATTAAVNYRLFERAQVPRSELGFALAVQALGSAAMLNLMLWLALVVSIPVSGFHPLYATAAGLGAALMAVFALAATALVRGDDRLAVRFASLIGRLPRVNAAQVERVTRRVAVQTRRLAGDRRRLVRAAAYAAANWLADAAALWLMLAAFGGRANPIGLLVAYGLANVVGAVPVSPGGLGVIEAVLIPTLVGFGTPASVAAVGVVAYRLVNFWLPIPAGLVAYVVIERRAPGPTPGRGLRQVIDGLLSSRRSPAPPTDREKP
ncbi:MAG: flippase-like domain-containing protein [Acidimicrobiia bacterium]|nr:flippase-like domain-containing protein [Acidimicrobiia bacterium]